MFLRRGECNTRLESGTGIPVVWWNPGCRNSKKGRIYVLLGVMMCLNVLRLREVSFELK